MRNSVLIVNRKPAAEAAEVLLYGDIGPAEWGMIDDKAFAEQLRSVGDAKTIRLRIDSAGGSAFTGISIYNQLKRHPARVEVSVDGISASIASIIAMAGDQIVMGEAAQMMIHDASTITWGNAAEMLRTADILDSLSGDLAGIYARRTGRSVDEMRDLMRNETWFTAEDAVAARLADRAVVVSDVKAHLEPAEAARFRHPPKSLLSAQLGMERSAARLSDQRAHIAALKKVSTLAARAAVYRKEHQR